MNQPEQAAAPASHEVMGLALSEPDRDLPLIVERSDGHTSISDLRWWLRDPDASAPPDVAAVDLIGDGPVLDVGCATGRHLEVFRERSLDAYGIDTCAEAIRLAQAVGNDCEVADVWDYRPPEPFAAVVALGGNLGIAGTLTGLRPFLQTLRDLAHPGGTLIVTSVDWRVSADRHQDHLRQQQARGRYPGEVRLRLRYSEITSAWFDWVWVDPDTLAATAAPLGLILDQTLWWGSKYAACLTVREPTR